jgi:hypothetical protein
MPWLMVLQFLEWLHIRGRWVLLQPFRSTVCQSCVWGVVACVPTLTVGACAGESDGMRFVILCTGPDLACAGHCAAAVAEVPPPAAPWLLGVAVVPSQVHNASYPAHTWPAVFSKPHVSCTCG